MKVRCLHLLRHGAVEQAGRLWGHGEAVPTMAGLADCRERVRGLTVGRVIASDLSRAAMAAQAIAQDFGAELSLDPRWRELDFGAWDGADPEDLGAAVQRFWDDPVGNPPPGGESWGVLRERVAIALCAIDDDALVITHAGPIRAALSILLGLDYRQSWAFHLPYASLISLRVWDDGAQVTGLWA